MRREEDLRQGRIANVTDPEHKRIGAFEKYTKVSFIQTEGLFLEYLCAIYFKKIGYRKTFIRSCWLA